MRVREICNRLNFKHELILVDDGCPSNAWNEIQRLANEHSFIVGVRLSRNFGQHAAIQAGLSFVRGDWIVVMDCDLQDRPEEVAILYQKALEGYDVVKARRAVRQDSLFRRIGSRVFYKVLGYLTGTKQSPEVANFGIYRRNVIDSIVRWNEDTKYFPAIVQWVGFKQTEVDVQHSERFSGQSSYDLFKLIKLGLNVVIGFSDKPLQLVMLFGFSIAAVSILAAVAILAAYLAGVVTVEGWTSLVLSVWFLAGCILLALGLVGLYIGRILAEAKGRPTFIVAETVKTNDIIPISSCCK